MPVVWLIDAYRAGERGQVRALVDALGWPSEVRQLSYRHHVFLPHLLGQASLRGITPAAREGLQPPWPDLVISSGVRNEPVCRWIRARSGGRTRYVHVGRPWGPLESFDLVVTTPQYRIPVHPNVLQNQLTLHSVTPQRLADARAEWAVPFADLPRPLVTVLVGGNSGPFTLGPRAAARLAQQASELARALGGSLLVTTSARTDEAATRALRAGIEATHYFHAWRSGDAPNPYLGMLAWADRLVVTGDSIGMLSEACATGKPVYMFDLGGMREGSTERRDFRLGASLYTVLLRWFWRPLTRDLTLVHRGLRESGRAVWLGEAIADSGSPPPGQTDLQRAVAAVERLVGET